MNLHVVTRCIRPENLRTINESFKDSVLTWHVVFDVSAISEIDAKILGWLYTVAKVYFKSGERDSYMYHILNDLVIENIDEYDWVTFIDDDNIMHPDYYDEIANHLDNYDILAICYNQQVSQDTNSIRVTNPGNTIVGGIDLAQFTVSAIVFKDRISSFKAGYCGDGEFIQELHNKLPEEFLFIDRTLSYYNYITQALPTKKSSAPSILYVGKGKPELKSIAHLGYEDTSLNVEYCTNKDLVWNDYNFSKYDAIITTQGEWGAVPMLPYESRGIRNRWVHVKAKDVTGELAYNVAMNSILSTDNPPISFFTPAYKTPIDKINRLYQSIQNQTIDNWEWVIVNDSPDDKKISDFLNLLSKTDDRVNVYTFKESSNGCIGNVKNKAASLCCGNLLAEVDHDDELLPLCAKYLIDASVAHPECGFFYTNCVEVDENYNSLKYNDGFAFGYGKYRKTYDTSVNWEYEESICVGINPKTIRHIVGVPNHIRAWRRSIYNKIGGHNRRLTIADDYELIVRTFLETKFCHIDACGYIQFIYNNNSGQNTHNSARGDIQRRVRTIMYHYNDAIAQRFYYLGYKDWAYQYNPSNPLLAPSQFGKEECNVNVIYSPK